MAKGERTTAAEVQKPNRLQTVLRQHFPGLPKTRQELYPRLFASLFLYVAMMVLLWVEPPKRMLNTQVLWLQFVGAALLWWEANAAEKIDLVVEELRKGPSAPTTRTERILYRVLIIFSFVPMVIIAAAVAAVLWGAAAPRGWHALLINELMVAAFVVLATVLALWSGRFFDRQLAKVASRIAAAEAQGRAEQREITRRALRTIGFALVALATFFQMVLVWVE